MIVAEVMTQGPQYVDVTETVRGALRALAEADVRHLPVVENGEVVGIVSDRDLQKVSPSALDELEHPNEVRSLLAQPISNLMSSDVVTFNAEDELTEVFDTMNDLRIGAVPVVEAGSRKLIGIVSYIDLLRAVRHAL
jgi:CBS domain-containing protein